MHTDTNDNQNSNGNGKGKAPKTVIEGLRAAGLNVTEKRIISLFPEDLSIIRDKAHPLYDPRVEEPFEQEMLDSIRTNGVMTPVWVRKNGLDENGKPILQVIAGRRRSLHACEVNRQLREKGEENRRISVIMVTGNDGEMLLLAMMENALRKDESVLSRAWKARAAIQQGRTVDEVRQALKCAPNTLTDLIDFLNLTPEVQVEFEKGTFPLGSIQTFVKIPREKQSAMLQKLLSSGIKKTHEVKAAVEAEQKGRPYKKPDMKKCLTRGQMEAWAAELNLYKTPEAEQAKAMLSFILGYRTALRGYSFLETAAKEADIETDVPVVSLDGPAPVSATADVAVVTE